MVGALGDVEARLDVVEGEGGRHRSVHARELPELRGADPNRAAERLPDEPTDGGGDFGGRDRRKERDEDPLLLEA